MKNLRSHFVFNRSQQNGIFLLVIIIVILQLIYHFVDFNSSEETFNSDPEDLANIQHTIDSLKLIEKSSDSIKLYPFNPNYLTDYKGYILGMSTSEIDKLLNYRKKDKWVNSIEDFQKVTGVSDSLLKKMTPYFKFPNWTKSSPSVKTQNLKTDIIKADLNLATAVELQKINGVGEVLSGRIVKYRNKIGGFVNDIQLQDIYGLSSETRKEILANYTVKTLPDFKVLNINKATVLQLSELPYLDYELAREIVNYRLLHETIHNFEELAKIKDFPSEKIDRIALYLSVD